jgi:hypothetical protein
VATREDQGTFGCFFCIFGFGWFSGSILLFLPADIYVFDDVGDVNFL